MRKILLINLLLSTLLVMSCDKDIKVIISFETFGGTTIAPIEVSEGTPIKEVLPENPIKEGFSFRDWYLDNNLVQAVNGEKANNDITLYANYAEKLYTVIYDGNGNTEGEVPVDDNLYATGDRFRVKWPINPAPLIKKDGKHLWGWAVEVNKVIDILHPEYDLGDGRYLVIPISVITVGSCDIELIGYYRNW